MRAAVLHEYGPPAAIRVEELPAPVPGEGQVLVRVRASSLNPLDVRLRSGGLRRVMPLRFPAVLGFDLAGEVVALGPGVTEWSPGDRVYGRTDAKTGGAHAEMAVVGARVLDRIPARTSFESAACLPLVAMTALQALRWSRLTRGERLLVNGAAGGVGSAAIQIGRALGANVTGTATGNGAALVAGLGASVLDYSTGALATTSGRFDVILDAVHGAPTSELRRLLARRGRYITTTFAPALIMWMTIGRLLSGRRFSFVVSRADGALMRELSALVAAGQLTAVVDSTYTLERIAEAYERLERGHLRGKVVITIG